MKARQFCSVCKQWLDMEVVPTGDGDEDDGVIWFRCPQCQGFLPKLGGDAALSGDDDDEAADAPDAEAPESAAKTVEDELPWDSPADMMAARDAGGGGDRLPGARAEAEPEDGITGTGEAAEEDEPAADAGAEQDEAGDPRPRHRRALPALRELRRGAVRASPGLGRRGRGRGQGAAAGRTPRHQVLLRLRGRRAPDRRGPRVTRRRRAGAAAAACAVLLAAAADAHAQLPHLDPLPWQAPADSLSRLALVVGVDRSVDDRTEWQTNRLTLTAILPAGADGIWFLRLPYLSFDTGGLGARERWPAIAGADTTAIGPQNDRLEGFGQIEAGAGGPLNLPGLGRWRYGLALGLPTGQNSLYPWSSTSLPLRMQLRRGLLGGAGWRLSAGGGYVLHLDAGGDELDAAAFPNGWQAAAELAVGRGGEPRWRLSAAFDDRNGRRGLWAGLQAWLPWTPDGAVGLAAARELAGTDDRLAGWRFGVSWRFDSPGQRPGAATPSE